MTRVHLVSSRATATTCPECRRAILAALDEGLIAHVDPTPINSAAEIAVLLTGRWTYTLTADRQLIHRDVSRITDTALRGTVHAEHRCPPKTEQGALF